MYECKDCHGREMRCATCVVDRHGKLYLHRIQVSDFVCFHVCFHVCFADLFQKWNGVYFERTSLKKLGLRIQLGHPPGEKCLHPLTCADDDFCVVDVNGVHDVGIDFCACGRSTQQHTVQLLRARLYPATVTAPKTAATYACLEAFELMSYESKITAFEYYQTLMRLTDNTGVIPLKVSFAR